MVSMQNPFDLLTELSKMKEFIDQLKLWGLCSLSQIRITSFQLTLLECGLCEIV